MAFTCNQRALGIYSPGLLLIRHFAKAWATISSVNFSVGSYSAPIKISGVRIKYFCSVVTHAYWKDTKHLDRRRHFFNNGDFGLWLKSHYSAMDQSPKYLERPRCRLEFQLSSRYRFGYPLLPLAYLTGFGLDNLAPTKT